MARRHPHPMLVHFPIAFLMGASLFILLHLLFQSPSCEITSLYLLILGAITSPLAMGSWPFHVVGQLSIEAHPFCKEKDSAFDPPSGFRSDPRLLAGFSIQNIQSHLFHPDACPRPNRDSPGVLWRPDDFPSREMRRSWSHGVG